MEVRKLYIAYRTGQTFLCVVPLAGELKLYLSGISPDAIVDPAGAVRDVRGVGQWGTGDIEVRLSTYAELDYVIGLITQTVEATEDALPDRDQYAIEAVNE
jgi:predicted transport protein